MELLIALTATKATLGLVFIFVVLFPAIVTGLIAHTLAQAANERQQNLDDLDGMRRDG